MNYAQARPLIRSGDLLAWGHDAWRTWHDWEIQAVRFFTRSEYAHVGVAWVADDGLRVIEAVVPQVRTHPLEPLLPCYWLAGELRNAWTQPLEDAALSKVGEAYSKWEAILSAIVKIVPGVNTKWQCAELAAWMRAPLLLEDYTSPNPSSLVHSALVGGANLNYLRG